MISTILFYDVSREFNDINNFIFQDSDELVVNKKRRLAKYMGMDQWDSHFAIQMDIDDEVRFQFIIRQFNNNWCFVIMSG